MKSTIAIAAFFAAILVGASSASASVRYVKDDDKSIVLVVKDDHTRAKIVKIANDKEDLLIKGEVELEEESGDFVIHREEGDVCAAVFVEMFNDINLGEKQVAKVRNLFEEAGSAARSESCAGTMKMEGFYSKVNGSN